MSSGPYILHQPSVPRSCAVFSSPHSGTAYGKEFLERSCLTELQLRSSEDAFVDLFLGETVQAPVLKACFPRAYVDLNREANELDRAIIAGANGQPTNPRIAAGLGVIPRVVAKGRAIMHGKMTLAEAKERLVKCYDPYHSALRTLIENQCRRFGQCHLFDFHSMPGTVLSSVPKRQKRPDVIIGDRYGTSCDRWLSDAVAEIFRNAGFEVAHNAPFAGGYITRRYGEPGQGVHAVQIEIDRGLYMDEEKIVPLPDFNHFRAKMEGLVNKLAALPPAVHQMAAE